MKILGLYNNPCAIPLFDWLRSQGNDIILVTEHLNPVWCKEQNFEFGISYTYRYILTDEILKALNCQMLNIHNSYLPWNRGADPNIWSIIDDSPRGVTIHFMNAALDKGRIIAQTLVPLEENDTFKSSYEKLDIAAKSLFKAIYPYRRYWHEMGKIPVGKGSYHSLKQGEPIKKLIVDYDMPVVGLKNTLKVLAMQFSKTEDTEKMESKKLSDTFHTIH